MKSLMSPLEVSIVALLVSILTLRSLGLESVRPSDVTAAKNVAMARPD